ncbi:ThuA domain-containing protein [Paludisphaera mucosa]|uniref:ThuA domain-containing protein n=1 Tax=Paludisphaera mucosa TaxID=3030827 RepID=A0ABT6F8Z9_9BACT|nr:ThuA domain-containing protein [Paludisphaera mucosa]MDG3004065.1 ThuA domain-containing protein [Paludisphaera mucosa]
MLGNRRPRKVLFALAFLILAAAAAAAAPIRVLILGGSDDLDRRASRPVLKRLLERSGRFDVRVCETPVGLGARTFEGFDLVVDDGGAGDAATAKALADFVALGKGLVVACGGVCGPSAAADLSPLHAGSVPIGPAALLAVAIVHPEHPIVAGLPGEIRTVGPVPAVVAVPGGETLAVAGAEKAPVLAARTHGAGRVAALALGRDAAALHEPHMGMLLARACEWAATGAVGSDVAKAPPTVRALLITGGHFHDASFYGLFDGVEGLDALPVETAAEAFKKDVRDIFDVVVFYDFTRDLDEEARKNLRAFVEAGKGIVVLHHALLDFQSWAWWSEEVVGGRYRLQREGDAPSSAVMDGVEMFVVPAGEHPVLRGVGPFLVRDEAYKNLYRSEKDRPLLTTDAPASDPILAWVGPCTTARVVAVQLGHGPSAYTHPSYRRLVHNAVRWSARKLD